jgi:hypothetical protein
MFLSLKKGRLHICIKKYFLIFPPQITVPYMLQNTVIYITFFNNDGQEGNKWIKAKRQL